MLRVHDSVAALADTGTGLWMAAVTAGRGPPAHLAGRAALRPPARVGPVHPFRFGIQCRGPADAAGWAAQARKVEDLGWSTLTVADHLDDGLAPDPRAHGRRRRHHHA